MKLPVLEEPDIVLLVSPPPGVRELELEPVRLAVPGKGWQQALPLETLRVSPVRRARRSATQGIVSDPAASSADAPVDRLRQGRVIRVVIPAELVEIDSERVLVGLCGIDPRGYRWSAVQRWSAHESPAVFGMDGWWSSQKSVRRPEQGTGPASEESDCVTVDLDSGKVLRPKRPHSLETARPGAEPRTAEGAAGPEDGGSPADG